MNSPPSGKIKLNSPLWPVLVGLLLFIQLFFPFRGWMILLVGLGGSWLISFFWARSLARHLHIQREMRFGWAQVGDMIEERFFISNNGAAPALWVEVIDHSTIPDYDVNRATGVEAHGHNSWLTRQVCTRRGLYRLGPTTVRTSDPFGIYTITLEDPAYATILVTPPILPLPDIRVAAGGRAGEGRPSNKAIEQTVVIAGVREYSPGDTVARVHWPTTARRGAFFVKTFSNLPAGDWWVLLDLDRSVQDASGPGSTEETSVILAASLADRGLKAGVPVGLVANARETAWLPPRLGEMQRWDILQALARVSPAENTLNKFLQNISPSLRVASSLVLITPDTTGEWLPWIVQLTRRGVVPTVVLVAPDQDRAAAAASLQWTLDDLGIAHFVVTTEMVDRPEFYPQPEHRWEWRTLSTGRVLPLHKPADVSWKALS